jgi:tetratricopeptide (TPR) repeat protein
MLRAMSKPQNSSSDTKAITDEQRRQRFQKMSERLPPQTHFKNGQKFMKSGQYEKALEAFKLATKFETDNPVYRAHFAWARYMSNPSESGRVKEILKECLKMSGRTVEANLFLARIFKKGGERSRALKYFEAAAGEDKNCVEAQREIRLFSMRSKDMKRSKENTSQSGDDAPKEKTESFFGKLFQRKR